MNNVISHPAFEREPVVNERRRGRPAGTISFGTHRRRKISDKFTEGWVNGIFVGKDATPAGGARPETDAERADRLEATIDKIANQFLWLLKEAEDPNLGSRLGGRVTEIVGFITATREARHE